MTLVTQADYAKQHGVSRKTVTKWKDGGYLVLSGGKVDAEATDAVLKDRKLGRFGRDRARVTAASASNGAAGGSGPRVGAATGDDPDDIDVLVHDIDDMIADILAGRFMGYAAAERIKENAAALKGLMIARKEAGEVIDLASAEAAMFEAFRSYRDAWLNFPARVGALMAADLGVDADKMTEALTAHVQSHLAELGEPVAEFGGED